MINIEELEELPIRLSINKSNILEFGYKRYDYRRFRYKGESINKLARRIIIKHINKEFDIAFNRFCKQIPKNYRYVFIDYFYNQYYNSYYIDNNGKIQPTKELNKYKGPYIFKSLYAQYEQRHKITGIKKPIYLWWDKTTHNINYNDYQYVLVKGWEKSFDSKQNRELKRLCAEKQKQKAKELRTYKKEEKEHSLEILHLMYEKERLRRKKEKENDMNRLLAHGFDPITSFRN